MVLNKRSFRRGFSRPLSSRFFSLELMNAENKSVAVIMVRSEFVYLLLTVKST